MAQQKKLYYNHIFIYIYIYQLIKINYDLFGNSKALLKKNKHVTEKFKYPELSELQIKA